MLCIEDEDFVAKRGELLPPVLRFDPTIVGMRVLDVVVLGIAVSFSSLSGDDLIKIVVVDGADVNSDDPGREERVVRPGDARLAGETFVFDVLRLLGTFTCVLVVLDFSVGVNVTETSLRLGRPLVRRFSIVHQFIDL